MPFFSVLAGQAGFGPAHVEVKVPCLTAWLLPHMERIAGIGPAPSVWKTDVLPLNYIRKEVAEDDVAPCACWSRTSRLADSNRFSHLRGTVPHGRRNLPITGQRNPASPVKLDFIPAVSIAFLAPDSHRWHVCRCSWNRPSPRHASSCHIPTLWRSPISDECTDHLTTRPLFPGCDPGPLCRNRTGLPGFLPSALPMSYRRHIVVGVDLHHFSASGKRPRRLL